MKKGQGSLEYLLILAAILAIAVVVVVVANSLMSAPQTQAKVGEDQYKCSLQQIELISYSEVGIINDVHYKGIDCSPGTVTADKSDASCKLGDNKNLYVSMNAAGNSCTYEKETPSPPPGG